MAAPIVRSICKYLVKNPKLPYYSASGGGKRTLLWPSIARTIHTTPKVLATNLKMPALSPTMEDGTIVQWHKQEGDAVTPGDMLCEVQTDKAVVAMEIEEDGVLAKILVSAESGAVKVGTLIAVLAEEGEDWQSVEVPSSGAAVRQVQEPEQAGAGDQAGPTATQEKSSGSAPVFGPAVRALLEVYGLSSSAVPASGPGGRLLKGDVVRHIKSQNLQPKPPPVVPPPAPPVRPPAPPPPPLDGPEADFVDIPTSGMRKVIAQRLTESKQTVPHAYSTASCQIDKLLKARKTLAEQGVKVSVNDFVIKAVATALQRVPAANAVWGADGTPAISPTADISVAVATDKGLITPIVTDVGALGVADVNATVKELAGRAREGKLQPHEYQGGSFTISNLGMFGVTEFSAVINPPQACILAVGGSQLVPDPDTFEARSFMTVSLSSDARLVSDNVAAEFLSAFKHVMEDPSRLMLG